MKAEEEEEQEEEATRGSLSSQWSSCECERQEVLGVSTILCEANEHFSMEVCLVGLREKGRQGGRERNEGVEKLDSCGGKTDLEVAEP